MSSGDQYFFESSSSKNINLYQPNKYALPNSSNMSKYAIYNQISTSGVDVNSSSSFSLILYSTSQINPQNYTFNLDQYSNTSINIEVYFNGEATCSVSRTDLQGVHSLSIVSPCQQNVTNVTVYVDIFNSEMTDYQINMTAVSDVNPTSLFLSQQCSSLPSLVNTGIITNGSIVCQPISCSGNSFYLADQNNRPFLGLYGGSYTFLGVQSGLNDLQLVNSYPENLLNSSLMDETIFEETGLPSGVYWGVTYDSNTETARAGAKIGIIAFSLPYGNYSFNTIFASTYPEYCSNITSGFAVQDSLIPIHFSQSECSN